MEYALELEGVSVAKSSAPAAGDIDGDGYTDLEEDLRAELDSPARSCAFPCNCIASGNQISHKLNVNTPEECGKLF